MTWLFEYIDMIPSKYETHGHIILIEYTSNNFICSSRASESSFSLSLLGCENHKMGLPFMSKPY